MGPGYCRNTSPGNKDAIARIFRCSRILWLSGLGKLSKPWTEATKAEEVEPVRWGPKREKAFQAIKGALASAPSLGSLDYSKPFKLFVPAESLLKS